MFRRTGGPAISRDTWASPAACSAAAATLDLWPVRVARGRVGLCSPLCGWRLYRGCSSKSELSPRCSTACYTLRTSDYEMPCRDLLITVVPTPIAWPILGPYTRAHGRRFAFGMFFLLGRRQRRHCLWQPSFDRIVRAEPDRPLQMPADEMGRPRQEVEAQRQQDQCG